MPPLDGRSGGVIAFESNRDGNWEIYVIDADGNNLQRITDHEASDRAPDWSPDGTRIAFESARDGDSEIFIMDTNGANPQKLTESLSSDFGPDWSPDGTQISFVLHLAGENPGLYLMNANGSNQRFMSAAAGCYTQAWQSQISNPIPIQ